MSAAARATPPKRENHFHLPGDIKNPKAPAPIISNGDVEKLVQ